MLVKYKVHTQVSDFHGIISEVHTEMERNRASETINRKSIS